MPLVKSVDPRDADAPGHYDIDVDVVLLRRRLHGEPALAGVMRRTGEDAEEAVRSHVPGAYRDPETGAVDINAGYDPDSDAGTLEVLIWHLVRREVTAALARN